MRLFSISTVRDEPTPLQRAINDIPAARRGMFRKRNNAYNRGVSDEWVRAGTVEEIEAAGQAVVTVGSAPVLVLCNDGRFFAVDNRCPHMGFPLHQGDVRDGILDCHWHHARFDITCGATFDPWADDVDCYAVNVKDGVVYVDPARPVREPEEYGLERLRRGLDENLRLVVAKAAIGLESARVEPDAAWALGARFGAKEHVQGWRSGLTILGAMANVFDDLAPEDRARASTQALAWIAAESEPARFRNH